MPTVVVISYRKAAELGLRSVLNKSSHDILLAFNCRDNEFMAVLINNGEMILSPDKKFAETIIFVPFFFGKKQQMRRHAEFVSSIGYDAVIFNLSYKWLKVIPKLRYSLKLGWGIKHVWTREITKILDTVPGDKILFTFSNPTTAALEATGLRKAKDVRGLICDGGPFFDLLKCNWNYFNHEAKIKNPFKRIGMNAYARAIWTIDHEKEIKRDLELLPKDFPILSIRGWLDPLVPVSCIEKAFEGHDHLDLEILNLPSGKHLDGLKNFPEIYKARVTDFLNSISTKI